MKNNMLNKLKSGYEEMEINPSADLWDQLDQKLEEKTEMAGKTSSHWWKYAAAVLLLISFGSIFYFNFNKDSDSEQTSCDMNSRSESIVDSEFPNPVVSDEVLHIEKQTGTMAGLPKSERKTTSADKTIRHEIFPVSIQPLTLQTPQSSPVAPVKIENTISSLPEVAVAAEIKTTYISSNELLLGREFDKTSKQTNTDAVKFGVFNFDNPKVENITVLGVTVYTDAK